MFSALKLRQNDLTAIFSIGMALLLIWFVPRHIFAAELTEETLYTTEVLGQMMLSIIPLLTAGYLFTDTLLYHHYIERSQRETKKGLMVAAFCLFYVLELAWLWFFVKHGELLIFDRAIVLVFVAALFLECKASLVVGSFAIVVRGFLIFFLDAGAEETLPDLSQPANLLASLISRSWIWYEPGVLALLAALLLGIISHLYYRRHLQQPYPLWIGFPCAFQVEVVYMGAVYWRWHTMTAFMDLIVNYTIPDILGIGAPTLLLLLMMDAALTDAARKRAQEAEIELERTKLLYLQSQINPHFLFNALTTIQGLTYEQPAKARALLAHLGDMYELIARYQNHLIPLEQELEHVQSYLVIATARWPERLKIEQSIAKDVNRQHPVPALILQPLVENAVEHGIAPKQGKGTVEIKIEETAAYMLIMIRDDGVGMTVPEHGYPMTRRNRSVGLQNVISRLQTLYGQAYTPQIHSRIQEGTAVTITIPKDR